MSFTDQKPRIATEADTKAPWSGYKNGERFYCYLCGHKFVVGDGWRWVCAGSIRRSNLLVCNACDCPDVLEKWKQWWLDWEQLSQTKYRFIANRLKDEQK